MIRIHTLGGLSVRSGDGRTLSGAAAQPRRMAILALLARAGERGMNRDKLLSLLWPDADEERGPRTLAQALYALRRDLGGEDVIGGARELCLDPGLVSTDVGDFTSAIARGDDERAVSLYLGPFLDGFHLPGAEEFSRWAERERDAVAQEFARALESLARGARMRGDPHAAVLWWRRLAALEPLNARVTVGLMEALVADGDRAGALKHSRIYELLVEQELDLPPDRDVMALAARLRQSAGQGEAVPSESPATIAPDDVPPPEHASLPSPTATVDAPAPAAAPVMVAPVSTERRWSSRRLGIIAVWAVGGAAAAMMYAWRARGPTSGTRASVPVVAIGHIESYGADSARASMAAPVADLLSTSLARSRGIRVVSPGRMLELMRSAEGAGDTTAGGFVNAARRAGASEVIDGILYGLPDGGMRLDLRRVDLASGAIGDVQSVQGRDLFTLVDSGTARLVTALGTDAPVGSVTDVTTRSLTAYRSYELGMRAYYRSEFTAALAYLDDALSADSMFALAAYYGAIASSVVGGDVWLARMERARALAARAPERERLTITADWAFRTSSPALRAAAETLAMHYPAEVEGYLYSAIALVNDGEFLAAIAPLEHVLRMDSTGGSRRGATCGGCEAFAWLVSAYDLADSSKAAERVAREWLRQAPTSRRAASTLVDVLDRHGLIAAAESVLRATAPTDQPYDEVRYLEAWQHIRRGEYAAADSLLRAEIRRGGAPRVPNAAWLLGISLREQGRLDEAFVSARRVRAFGEPDLPKGAPQAGVALEAQVELERGRPRVSAALFDSISRGYLQRATPSERARHGVWNLTHAAAGRVAAGDTASLPRLADSVQALGMSSGFGRDRRLYHHIRGLILAARGKDTEAITEFRSALYSLPLGYTRTNLELGRVLLRARRPREAIDVLQPALRGSLESSNLYVSRTELHEALARAWDAAGGRDSARAHYDIVARSWSAGDPPFKARAAAARARAAALKLPG